MDLSSIRFGPSQTSPHALALLLASVVEPVPLGVALVLEDAPVEPQRLDGLEGGAAAARGRGRRVRVGAEHHLAARVLGVGPQLAVRRGLREDLQRLPGYF